MDAELYFEHCCGLCKKFIVFQHAVNKGTCIEVQLAYPSVDYYDGIGCKFFTAKPDTPA